MRLFSCCLGPVMLPRLGGNKDTVEGDTIDEKLRQLTLIGYASPREKIRQAVRVMMDTSDDSSSRASFRSSKVQELCRELLSTTTIEIPVPRRSQTPEASTHHGSSSIDPVDPSTTESILFLLAMLLCLVRDEDNRRAIADSRWLLDAIVKTIPEQSDGSDSRLFAFSVLKELSTIPAARPDIIRIPRFLDITERIISAESPRSPVRSAAFATLWSLAITDENKVLLFRRNRLMELCALLINVEEPPGSEVRGNVVGLLWLLSEARENKMEMMRTLTLLTACQNIIESEPVGAEIKVHAFGMLENLASAKENKADLFKSSWLLSVTKKVLREEAPGSEVKAKALGVLWNLAASRRNQDELCKIRWLVETLEKTISREAPGSRVKANAFGVLWNVAGAEDGKVPMWKSKRLQEITEQSLREEQKGSEVRANALGMLCEIAVAEDIKQEIFEHKSLMEAVKKSLDDETAPDPSLATSKSSSEIKAGAFGLFWNLALSRENQVPMCQQEWLMNHTERILKDEPMTSEAKSSAFALLWNLAVSDENKSKLFAKKWISELAIDAIAQFDPAKNNTETVANAFGLLQNLASTRENQIKLFNNRGLLAAIENVLHVLVNSVPLPQAMTPRTARLQPQQSGRFTPLGSTLASSNSSSGGAGWPPTIQSEVVVNCFGLLQNFAFAEENKASMCSMDWLVSSAQRVIAESAPGTEVKSNVFGMLWNIANLPNNQQEMMRSERFFWLLPSIELVLREEAVGSSVKTYALALLKELCSHAEFKSRLRRLSWISDAAGRVMRDESVGSQAKVNVLGLLAEIAVSEDCARMNELLALTEHALKEETNKSSVKLMAFHWLAQLARRDDATAVGLMDRHPSIVNSAVRGFQGEDKATSVLASALDDFLLALVQSSPQARQKVITIAPNVLKVLSKRLANHDSPNTVQPIVPWVVLGLLMVGGGTSLNTLTLAEETKHSSVPLDLFVAAISSAEASTKEYILALTGLAKDHSLGTAMANRMPSRISSIAGSLRTRNDYESMHLLVDLLKMLIKLSPSSMEDSASSAPAVLKDWANKLAAPVEQTVTTSNRSNTSSQEGRSDTGASTDSSVTNSTGLTTGGVQAASSSSPTANKSAVLDHNSNVPAPPLANGVLSGTLTPNSASMLKTVA